MTESLSTKDLSDLVVVSLGKALVILGHREAVEDHVGLVAGCRLHLIPLVELALAPQ